MAVIIQRIVSGITLPKEIVEKLGHIEIEKGAREKKINPTQKCQLKRRTESPLVKNLAREMEKINRRLSVIGVN